MIKKLKSAQRAMVKKRISLLSDLEKETQTRLVTLRLQELPEFRQADTIMLFWSMNDEINTHELIKNMSVEKKILLPVIEDGNMVVKTFTSIDTMRSDNPLHISEPTGITVPDPQPDLILMPGRAFDAACNRLGRGKGFYDSFLARMKYTGKLIAIAFNEQIVDAVPIESHDVPLDGVVTANQMYFKPEK